MNRPGPKEKPNPLIVVSGLPRSGTSMVMQMLEQGGLDVVTDNVREADLDNPKGYYELEKVKRLRQDKGWLKGMGGKAVKIISMLLHHLPEDLEYRVIFLHRDMDEILASQQKMLFRKNGQGDEIPDGVLARKFKDHLSKVQKWVRGRANMACLNLNYEDVVTHPMEGAERIRAFLGLDLDLDAMVSAVDSSLYRNRASQPAGVQ